MSKTRAQLRATLARQVQRYFAGTATGGSTTTIVDTAGLERWSETDALTGAYAFISAAGGSAPEGESARIKSFNATSNTITLDTALSAAVASGDSYELYLAPLDLESWNECINEAIRAAWPEVWERAVNVVKDFTRSPIHAMPSACAEIVEVWAYPFGSTEVDDLLTTGVSQWLKRGGGFTPQLYPPALWRQEGTPGTDLNLHLLRQLEPGGVELHVYYKARYTELVAESGTTGTTDLDPAYVLAAARASWYELMGNASRGQADQSTYLQLMNHWQQVAAEARRALAAQLIGLSALEWRKGK